MKRLLIILGLVLAVSGGARAETLDDAGPVLTVTGRGIVSAVPDLAVIHLGVREIRPEAAAAASAVADIMGRILSEIEDAGIGAKDMQTTQLTLSPQFDHYGSGAPKQVGFEASSTLQVTVRSLAGLGEVIDRVMVSGGNYFNGLQFDLSTRSELEDAANKAAVQQAMHKARVLADAAGMALGPVRFLQEGHAQMGPQPMLQARAMDAGFAMPVAAGELDVTALVTMEFTLRDKD